MAFACPPAAAAAMPHCSHACMHAFHARAGGRQSVCNVAGLPNGRLHPRRPDPGNVWRHPRRGGARGRRSGQRCVPALPSRRRAAGGLAGGQAPPACRLSSRRPWAAPLSCKQKAGSWMMPGTLHALSGCSRRRWRTPTLVSTTSLRVRCGFCFYAGATMSCGPCSAAPPLSGGRPAACLGQPPHPASPRAARAAPAVAATTKSTAGVVERYFASNWAPSCE